MLSFYNLKVSPPQSFQSQFQKFQQSLITTTNLFSYRKDLDQYIEKNLQQEEHWESKCFVYLLYAQLMIAFSDMKTCFSYLNRTRAILDTQSTMNSEANKKVQIYKILAYQIEGEFYFHYCQYTKSYQALEEALLLIKELEPKDPTLECLKIIKIQVLRIFGKSLLDDLYYKHSILQFDEALSILKTLNQEETSTQYLTALIFRDQAFLYSQLYDYTSAGSKFKRSLKIFENLKAFNDIEYRITLLRYGRYQAEISLYDEGIENISKAMTYFSTIFYQQPNYHLAKCHYEMAKALMDGPEEIFTTRDHLDKACQIISTLFSEKHSLIADIYHQYANSYRMAEQYEKAFEYVEKGLVIYKEFYNEKHPYVAFGYSSLGKLLKDQEKHEQSLEYFEKALQISKGAFGDKHPEVSNKIFLIGTVYQSKRQFGKALEYFDEQSKCHDSIMNAKYRTAEDSFQLGLLYKENKDIDKAMDEFKKVLELYKEIFGKTHPRTSSQYQETSLVYRQIDKVDEALDCLNAAVTIQKAHYNEKHWSLSTLLKSQAEIYIQQRKFWQAHIAMGQINNIEDNWNLSTRHEFLYMELGDVFMGLGQTKHALAFIDKAYAISSKIRPLESQTIGFLYLRYSFCYSEVEGKEKLTMKYALKSENILRKYPNTANAGEIMMSRALLFQKFGYYEEFLKILKRYRVSSRADTFQGIALEEGEQEISEGEMLSMMFQTSRDSNQLTLL